MSTRQQQTQFLTDSDWPNWYKTVDGCYDEYRSSSGHTRTHWQALKRYLQGILHNAGNAVAISSSA